MTPKEFYSTYLADDNLSELSDALIATVMQFNPVHVLDFGGGTGKHCKALEKHGVEAWNMDLSQLNIVHSLFGNKVPVSVCGDETRLRHLCNFDVVMTCSVLDHIQDVEPILREFQRIANKAVVLAETQDLIGEFYFANGYEELGFQKTDYKWLSPHDGALYKIFIWRRPDKKINPADDDLG